MIFKKTDENGEKYYVDSTGKRVRLIRETGGKNTLIPNGIYGVYKKPQQRGVNKADKLIKEV